MPVSVQDHVIACRSGRNPALVCRVPSGWVVLCNMQFLRGYCILQPDPVVESLNDLDQAGRAAFLCDMAIAGDALLEVTGAYRINYAILSNSDPVLHAHIVPRYDWEPEELRHGLPWSYSQQVMDETLFDPCRDQALIEQLGQAIRNRLSRQH